MSAKNIALIKKINKAFADGNTDIFLDYLAEDARWNIIAISSFKGKESIRTALEKQDLETLPVVTVKKITAIENSVMVASTGSATRKSGLPYTASYCDVYQLKEGKINEFTTYVVESD